MMKKGTKALLLSFCAVVLVVGSVLGTMAYLTDNDTVTNTFTVGKVDIDLKETQVKTDGTVADPTASNPPMTDEGNAYHLIPGHTYKKDPTVTVKAGSESAYIKMTVTVNFASELDKIVKESGKSLAEILTGYDSTKWTLKSNTEDKTNNTRTYEFWYCTTVAGEKDGTAQDVVLEPLFTNIVVPGSVTNEDLAKLYTLNDDDSIKDKMEIVVKAYAMQADGFDTAEDAWAAFPTT